MAADSRGSELRVNTSFVAGDQDNPAIAVSPLGTFVVVWESEEQDGDGEGIYAQIYRSGGAPLDQEFLVNRTTTEDDQTNPDVAMDANGGFVVVWESESDEGQSIYAQRYDLNGQRVDSEFRVSPIVDSENSDPALARNDNGAFVVAWAASGIDDEVAINADTSSTGIYIQRYDTDGSPLDATRVNTITLDAQDNPEVAIQRNGSFIVVWESDGQDTDSSGIFAQRYNTSGNPIGIEFQVNTIIRNDQINPVVAVDLAGNFVVAWESDGEDGSGSGIYARLYDANGNPRGTPFRVNSTTRGDQSAPTIGMDAEGNFTIAWTSDRNDDDQRSGIYAQQYSVNGERIDDEFRVNSTTEDDQTAPSIATQSNGDFVVAWQSETPNRDEELGDGDGLGIFAQRYRGSEDIPTNRIEGDSDPDRLSGDEFANILVGYGGNDTLLGGGNNDTLEGGSGNDNLEGQKNDDILRGGADRDILKGGTGADTLYGGTGRDTMIGGAGPDIFVIGERFGLEEIQDFQDGIDLIRLNGAKVSQLTIEEQQGTKIISIKNNPIALLENIPGVLINSKDFI